MTRAGYLSSSTMPAIAINFYFLLTSYMDNLPMTYEELTEEIRKVKRAEMIGPNEG